MSAALRFISSVVAAPQITSTRDAVYAAPSTFEACSLSYALQERKLPSSLSMEDCIPPYLR